MNPRSLFRVSPEDAEYRRQAAAEAEFWRRVHPSGLESMDDVDQGPIDRYTNLRFTGDENRYWYETIAARGPFRRGALLGTSSLAREARILESNPSLHLTVFDLSSGGLARREEVLGKRFRGRVATCVADLNFIELEPNSYDLIVSASTIHHVTNLEYAAYQINRALVGGGYFFIEDYVGEPRFQFTAGKQRIYRELFNRDRVRRGVPPTDLIWLDASDLSPFCGVRSDDILDVLRTHLEEVDVRTACALTVPIARSRPVEDRADSPWVSDQWVLAASRWRRLVAYTRRLALRRVESQQTLLSPAFLQELFLVGDVLADADAIKPAMAFAVYRKRS